MVNSELIEPITQASSVSEIYVTDVIIIDNDSGIGDIFFYLRSGIQR